MGGVMPWRFRDAGSCSSCSSRQGTGGRSKEKTGGFFVGLET